MHVVLLHDELSADSRPDERDVLVQVDAISTALRELRHQISTLGLSLDFITGAKQLTALKPDLVFNLVEALAGQGRLIYLAPALLDSLRIPYTGASTEAMFLTSSKTLTKQFLAMHGLPTAPWLEYTAHASLTPYHPRENLDLSTTNRWIIKSTWEEASVGLDEDSVVTVSTEAELRNHIRLRLDQIGGAGFAEAYIDGREFNLALLPDPASPDGCIVLPPAEIEFIDYGPDKPRVVGYRAKWDEESFEYQNTRRSFDFAPGDTALLECLQTLAVRCWRVFNLRGYARVDFRVDAAGHPWILEINANPCISPDAGLIAAATRADLTYRDVVQRIMTDT